MARGEALLRETERAEALQRDSARLLASVNSREPVWLAYGDPTWLASVTAPDKGHPLVVVVRAGEVLASVTSTCLSAPWVWEPRPPDSFWARVFPACVSCCHRNVRRKAAHA